MHTFIRFLFQGSLALLAIAGKAQGPAVNTPGTASLQIEFENYIGSDRLQLNTGTYTNASGEQFSVTLLNYYISNIRLNRADGTLYTVPRDSSYFLIKAENPAQNILLKGIPAGTYTGISFILGIDSAKCTTPVADRTGVLDPAGGAAGMYWGWNSGYIFVKMEGPSAVATSGDKKFRYHIGGFGGFQSPTLNNIKEVHIDFPAAQLLQVQSQDNAARLFLKADASKVMNGTTNVSIAAKTTVMFAPYSVNIANNYASMFSFERITNN